MANASGTFVFSHRGALGDFLLTWPTLVSLRWKFRNSPFLGIGKPEYMEMAREFGLVDDFIDCESAELLSLYGGDAGKALPSKLSDISGALFWMDDAPEVAGMLKAISSGVVHLHQPFPSDSRHVMDHHATALSFFSLPSILEGDVYFPLSIHRESYALIHPGSGSPDKNYDPEFYAFIGNELKNTRFADTRILLGPTEQSLRAIYANRFKIEEPASCLELARLVSRSSLFIGNDSGVSHLAALTGAKTLALYKATSYLQWGIRGRNAQCLEAANEAQAMNRIQKGLELIKR